MVMCCLLIVKVFKIKYNVQCYVCCPLTDKLSCVLVQAEFCKYLTEEDQEDTDKQYEAADMSKQLFR